MGVRSYISFGIQALIIILGWGSIIGTVFYLVKWLLFKGGAVARKNLLRSLAVFVAVVVVWVLIVLIKLFFVPDYLPSGDI